MKNDIIQPISVILSNAISNKTLTQASYSLIHIILLILFLSWLTKKLFLIKKIELNNLIKIRSRISIGSHESILIVDVPNNIRLIVGVTKNNISTLHTLTDIKKKNISNNKQLHSNVILQKINFKKNFFLVLKKISSLRMYLLFFLCLFSPTVYSATSSDIMGSTLLQQVGKEWSFSIQALLFISALTFLPAILLMMTSFTRIIIVFGLVRNALGTPYAPSNQILVGLALFLTFFIMSPICDTIYNTAYLPFSRDEISMSVAIEKGICPLKKFMINQTRESDLKLFSTLDKASSFTNKDDIPMRIVLPSFVTSELKTAFQIGCTIFIPFVIIDLVIASVLMSLGMMMVPPSSISLPFKLMLFVLVDGWQLLITSLAQSFFVN